MFLPGEAVWTCDGYAVTIHSGPHRHGPELDGYMVMFEDTYMDFLFEDEMQREEPTDEEANEVLGLGMIEEPL